MRIFLLILVCLFGLHANGLAQADSIQNLYFIKEGAPLRFAKNDYQPGDNAFYIYRHCIYHFVLQDKTPIAIRVVDIRNDSIYYTRAFQSPAALQADTLALHPSSLRKLSLIGDRIFGLYKNYSLTNYQYVLEKATLSKELPVEKKVEYATDSSYSVTYELVCYLTVQGLDRVYEYQGRTYYYEGGSLPRPGADSTRKHKLRPFQEKKWVWFTPTNVNKVRGVNIGLQTMTVSDRDTLIIQGVNINADALTGIGFFYFLMRAVAGPSGKDKTDTIEKRELKNQLSGLSISGCGLVSQMLVRGMTINGGVNIVTEARGLQISGLLHQSHTFHGVTISGLYNESTKGRGLQVALFNKCKDLKGFQVGLWNVSGKRKLPFINWGF